MPDCLKQWMNLFKIFLLLVSVVQICKNHNLGFFFNVQILVRKFVIL